VQAAHGVTFGGLRRGVNIQDFVIPGRERSSRTRNPVIRALEYWIPDSRLRRLPE